VEEPEAATLLGHAEGTMYPASFGHIVGVWRRVITAIVAEALALDMLSSFTPNMLDPGSARFRTRCCLRRAEKEMDLVRDFLGHAPHKRFLADMAGQ
jgi:hypothetical protein